jgi:hypothetical protein
VRARICQLDKQLGRARIEHDQDSLRLRIARLSGRVAVVRVGAATSVELKERMLRVEDSLAAARAALEEGVVTGGGAALAQAAISVALPDLDGFGQCVAGADRVTVDGGHHGKRVRAQCAQHPRQAVQRVGPGRARCGLHVGGENAADAGEDDRPAGTDVR